MIFKDELTYSKQDLLDILKRHTAADQVNYKKECAFTQNSINMVIRFVCLENDITEEYTEQLVKGAIKLTEELGGCLMGKSRLTIAGAFMYIASNRQLIQTYLAKRLYVTEVAIRNVFRYICICIDVPSLFPSGKYELVGEKVFSR